MSGESVIAPGSASASPIFSDARSAPDPSARHDHDDHAPARPMPPSPCIPPVLGQLLPQRARSTPDAPAVFERDRPGHWRAIAWRELDSRVIAAARRLASLGLRRGDCLAILAPTSPDWLIAELAAYSLGAVVLGLDPHAPTAQHHQHLQTVQIHMPLRGALISGNGPNTRPAPPPTAFHLAIDTLTDPATDASTTADASAIPPVSPDDTAVLIATSGTTGQPRLIPYSHRQVLAAVGSICDAFPAVDRSDRLLCWLPMAHLFQRMMNLVAVQRGASLHFVRDPRQVMEHLAEVRPTVITAVPRFYEKVQQGILARIDSSPALVRGIARRALRAARRRPGSWTHRLADALVLRRIRAVLGGATRLLITGSAPCPRPTLDFFADLGTPLYEAYGVSENTVPMAANLPGAHRPGTVGRAFPHNDLRLADDAEVLVRGPGVFTGYLGDDPARRDDRFTPDGYYRTGDIAAIDADGYLSLTGRKSELIKTSTGRRIALPAVEAVYRQCPLVDHIIVIGHARPYLTALLTLNVPAVIRALRPGPIGDAASESSLAGSPAVRQLLERSFDELAASLAEHERIVRFDVLPAPLSIPQGELTPSLKPRRAAIESRHAARIDDMYCR